MSHGEKAITFVSGIAKPLAEAVGALLIIFFASMRAISHWPYFSLVFGLSNGTEKQLYI